MGSNICINVEFVPSVHIRAAIQEAKEKARLWDVAFVRFKFNGISVSVGKHANIEDAVKRFKSKDKSIKIAVYN